jgi:hypothetical protein
MAEIEPEDRVWYNIPMMITVELEPDVESSLSAQAAERNVSVKDYVEAILRSFAVPPRSEFPAPGQRANELDQWLKSHDYITAPPLSDEAVTRENIYREREDSQL